MYIPIYKVVINVVDERNGDEVVSQGWAYLHPEKRVGTPVMGMEVLLEEAAETEFWSVMRNFRKSQEEYQVSEIWAHITDAEEELFKEAHAKDYIGTDDDMPDEYESWSAELSLDEIEKILASQPSSPLLENAKGE